MLPQECGSYLSKCIQVATTSLWWLVNMLELLPQECGNYQANINMVVTTFLSS